MIAVVAWIFLDSSHLSYSAARSLFVQMNQQQRFGAQCTMQHKDARDRGALMVGQLVPPTNRIACHRTLALQQETVLQEEECRVPQPATISASIVSLVKNIVGAGVLALPSSVAAFSDKPHALFPAILVVWAIGCASAYSFALIARACEMTGGTTYREAWARAVGGNTAWLVTLVTIGKAAIACLMCSMILADTGSALALAIGAPTALSCRSGALLAVTCFAVMPLCFMESLSVLKYTSFAGICGMLYTIAAMCFRMAEGSYLPGGRFHDKIVASLQPSIAVHGGSFLSTKSYLLVSCLGTAYVAHYNAPKYYRELENPTLPRFYQLVAAGFGVSALLFCVTMSFGFLTFGGNSAGFILNNYATEDGLVDAARAAIGFSILCTYPLFASPLREGVLEMMGQRGDGCLPSKLATRRATVVLITIITALAMVLRNLGRVAAVSGGVFGSCVMYIFPAVIFLAASKNRLQTCPPGSVATGIRRERLVCRLLLAFGSCMALVSVANIFR